MLISNRHLRYCIEKTDEISDQFILTYLNADDPVRSVDYLLDLCQKYLNVKIKIIELPIASSQSSIWGMSVKNDGSYEIVHAEGLNPCWKRFVICKELFHVVLDAEEFRNMDLLAHIEEVTVSFPDVDSKPGNPVVVEMLAEFSAMEFLFAYKKRQQSVKGGAIDFMDIAKRHMVPRVHVEKYLSETFMAELFPFSRRTEATPPA